MPVRHNRLRAEVLLALVVCLVAAGGSAGAQDAPDVAGHPMIGSPAPEFELATVTGDRLSLRDLRGQWVVIHFGASW